MNYRSFIDKLTYYSNLVFDSQPLVYNSGDKCNLLLYNEVNEERFNYVCSGLQNEFQFELINENIIERNNFKFFLNGEILVCAEYFHCNNSVRLIVDGNTSLPDFVPHSVNRTSKTTLWQFEVDHSLIDCGMCYIIRTCTGSFFIVDSAHTYSVNDCERIHDFLRERTPKDQKIHIAGWFITHGHDDHVAQFANYLDFYMQDTVIDKIYINLISLNHRDSHLWSTANKMYTVKTYKALANHPEIPVVRLHTGMSFYIDNLKFDTLCTHEDVFPEDNSNYNDSSIVLMVTVEGTKILITGDAGHKESFILEERYPQYLKSDIVQQAHHCHFGTTDRFYELVDAKCVLFPATQIKFDETWNVHSANRKSVEIAKGNYYIASNGTVEIDLPYFKGEEKLFPDETFESFKGVYDLWAYEYPKEYKERLYNDYLARGGKPLEEYKDGFLL